MKKLIVAISIFMLGILTLINVINPYQIYKQITLEDFYNKITLAFKKNDCVGIYNARSDNYQNQNLFSTFVIECEKNKQTRREDVTVHKFWVENNKGYVYRTHISCLSAKCIGKDKSESSLVKTFYFKNGRWTIADEEIDFL